jgi:uncharacterized membrane protein
MRVLHIAAGLLALVSGAVALCALKGGGLHRRSGTVFVYAMLFMAGSGALLAALKGQRLNLMAGVLTFYLVLTAMLTVRRPAVGSRWLDLGALLVAFVGGLAALALGIEVSNSPSRRIDGVSAAPAFLFGTVALLGAVGDLRMMTRGLAGARRIARHLWRMCFGLFVAAASFFLGQAQVFPREVRSSGVLFLPVLVVLVLMPYWLIRVRFTQWHRRLAATTLLPMR